MSARNIADAALMPNTWLDRLEKYPRKARRAKYLLCQIGKAQAACEAIAEHTANDVRARYQERAATWQQRGLRVQLWVHWEEGNFHAAKAQLVKAEKQGQQDFWGLL